MGKLVLLNSLQPRQHRNQDSTEMRECTLTHITLHTSQHTFKLLPSKDESLLIRWDSFLVLNLYCGHEFDDAVWTPPSQMHLRLDIVNGVIAFHLQRDGLACQSLHKDLHCQSQKKFCVEVWFLRLSFFLSVSWFLFVCLFVCLKTGVDVERQVDPSSFGWSITWFRLAGARAEGMKVQVCGA